MKLFEEEIPGATSLYPGKMAMTFSGKKWRLSPGTTRRLMKTAF
jgi:hypothetical protein